MKKMPKAGNVFISQPSSRGSYALSMNSNMRRAEKSGCLHKLHYKLANEWQDIHPDLRGKSIMDVDFKNKKIDFYPYTPSDLKSVLNEEIAAYEAIGFTVRGR